MGNFTIKHLIVSGLVVIFGSIETQAQRFRPTPVLAGLTASSTVATLAGDLREGQSVARYVWLSGGSRYTVSGVCDNDCTDLDLRVMSPAGVELDRDFLTDDVPVLAFRAPTSGRYHLEVSMARCSIAPCRYDVEVVAR